MVNQTVVFWKTKAAADDGTPSLGEKTFLLVRHRSFQQYLPSDFSFLGRFMGLCLYENVHLTSSIRTKTDHNLFDSMREQDTLHTSRTDAFWSTVICTNSHSFLCVAVMMLLTLHGLGGVESNRLENRKTVFNIC